MGDGLEGRRVGLLDCRPSQGRAAGGYPGRGEQDVERPSVPVQSGAQMRQHQKGGMTELIEIIVEPNIRRRRPRRPLSGKKKAAALFRVWHGVRELIEEAERLGDSELVHFLAVAQLLVEERATTATSGVAAFDQVDTSLPN